MMRLMKFVMFPFYCIISLVGGMIVSTMVLTTVMASYIRGTYRAFLNFYEVEHDEKSEL